MGYLAIALLCLAQTATNDPASWYLSRSKENRQSEIDFLSRQIPLTRHTLIAAKKSRMKTEASKIASEMDEMEARLNGLKSGKARARVFLNPDTIAVGQAGSLSASEILQITSSTSAIVRLKNLDQKTIVRPGKSFVTAGTEIFVWVEMESTVGMADGRLYDFGDSLFEVAGTKTYRTAMGTERTAFWLRPFTLPPPAPAARAPS